jgi:GntR family transcriptional regulator / MocR family aminotransferase
MLPYRSLILIDKKASLPVYQQIAHQLIRLVQKGHLQPGTALPSTRDMASFLSVHRKTVVAAYEELFIQDWVESQPRKGFIVSPQLPELKPRSFRKEAKVASYSSNTGFDLTPLKLHLPIPLHGDYRWVIDDGFPDGRIIPTDSILKAYREYFSHHNGKAPVMNASGALSLRSELATFLNNTRGLSIEPHHILITHGAQMAIYLTARLLLRPGANVLVGTPNYFYADRIFQQAGARLIRIPVDENGIDVDAIARYCRTKKPDLLYIIPHHHHPTTVTLSAERRMQLSSLIQQYHFPVLEDDYDYDFHYSSSPILPLASTDHGGRIIYIGSLTKLLSPTIRLGYLIAPQNFIEEATCYRRLMDIRGDHMLEEVMAMLFKRGEIQRHIKKSVKLYHQRRDHFAQRLQEDIGDAITFRKPDGGLAAWVQFHKKHSLPAIAARARTMGLSISNGKNYSSGPESLNGLRMGFASLNEMEIESALALLRNSL